MILIMLTGGGNFIANQQRGNQLSYEQQEAISRVREIHQSLDQFEERAKATAAGIEASLRNQTQMLHNQNQVMASDARILEQLHRFQQNLGNPMRSPE